MVQKRTCDIEGCDGEHCARGFCRPHYHQWHSPDKVRVPGAVTLAEWVTTRDRSEGCWEWHLRLLSDGYGQVMYEGVMWRAHRLALVLDGDDPTGSLVLHSCDNPPCVNPDHLRIGTHVDNHNDMVERGRAAWQSR